jgi:hypothetical protein
MTRLSTYLATLAITICLSAIACAQTSQWAQIGPNGTLVYKTLPKGDHIMDFSTAGYMGGGVALPTVPVKITVQPSGGDDTTAIQNAINSVSAMPLSGGFRGAVLLAAGTFHISRTLTIASSGVVLRGSGSGTGGTLIRTSGVSLAVRIAGSGSPATANSVSITGTYLPSGSQTIPVASAAGFHVGNNVIITRTVTAAWVHFMHMDTLVRNGVHQTWLAPGTRITTDRTITAISGNTITLDAPVTDSFDAQFLGTPIGTVATYSWPGRISQDGLEHLRIQVPTGTTVFSAVTMDNIIDSWIQDAVGQESQNAWNVNKGARRITLDHVINNISTTQTRAAGTGDFSVTGTQVLVNKCQSNGTGDWPFITAAVGTGPIVFLNVTTSQRAGISPHQRWTTGILADGATLPNPPQTTPGIAFRNRGTAGSGQGWTSGWSVAWNVTTPWFMVNAPPGTENFCIGCIGSSTSGGEAVGIFDSENTKVTPASLYLEQLKERLGVQAVHNIGY